jgi:hypothetical protein
VVIGTDAAVFPSAEDFVDADAEVRESLDVADSPRRKRRAWR